MGEAFFGRIAAEGHGAKLTVGGRWNPLEIELVELSDVGEDALELTRHALNFVGLEVEVGEAGDGPHLVFADDGRVFAFGHGRRFTISWLERGAEGGTGIPKLRYVGAQRCLNMPANAIDAT